ncbi:MAG: hypothetical protein R6U96_05640 [Promethearchaeia archaeon]
MGKNMDLSRIIQVYVIQLGVGGIFYLVIAFLILRRNRNRLNKIFSMYFISIAIGTIINVIYVSLESIFIIKVLNILTYYFFCFGQVFLLLFSLILIKSERVINTKKQLIIIIVFAILLTGLFVIGLGFNAVTLNDKNKPVWDFLFVSYTLIVCGLYNFIPTLYFSAEIYKKFEDQQLKRKWKFFLLGIIIYYFVWGGTTLSNHLNIPAFRMVWSLISLIALISTYTIYYGVGKQL